MFLKLHGITRPPADAGRESRSPAKSAVSKQTETPALPLPIPGSRTPALWPSVGSRNQHGTFGLFERDTEDIRVLMPGIAGDCCFSAELLVLSFTAMLYGHSDLIAKHVIPKLSVYWKAELSEGLHIAEQLIRRFHFSTWRGERVSFDLPGFAYNARFNAQELMDFFGLLIFKQAGVISAEVLPRISLFQQLDVAEALCAAEVITTECKFGTELDEEGKGTVCNPTKLQEQAWRIKLDWLKAAA